jgi:hypothetical protein
MKKIILLLIIFSIIGTLSFSQSILLSPTVLSSAGDYSEGSNISLSWTLGELAVSTLSNSSLTLTQGFQQSYPLENAIKMNPIEWNISAYPNPVSSELRIQFDVLETSDFLIEIQDLSGRTLVQKEYKQIVPGDLIIFDMSSYKSGAYFFRISTTDRQQVRVVNIRKI